MKTFVRDSTIKLKFNFYDVDGNPVNPATATVTISYLPENADTFTFVTYPLVRAGNDWTYQWDSSVASPCVIQVHAQTTDGQPESSVDAEFRLKANRANRQLSGDYYSDSGYA
jgi:uncharacterized protein YfaS (alpha-2-macroglobulin family)